MSFATDAQIHEFLGRLERLMSERGGRIQRWADAGGGELTIVGGHPDGQTISVRVQVLDGYWAHNDKRVPVDPRSVATLLLRAGRHGSPVQSMRRPPAVEEAHRIERERTSHAPMMTKEEVYAQSERTGGAPGHAHPKSLDRPSKRKVTIAG